MRKNTSEVHANTEAHCVAVGHKSISAEVGGRQESGGAVSVISCEHHLYTRPPTFLLFPNAIIILVSQGGRGARGQASGSVCLRSQQPPITGLHFFFFQGGRSISSPCLVAPTPDQPAGAGESSCRKAEHLHLSRRDETARSLFLRNML